MTDTPDTPRAQSPPANSASAPAAHANPPDALTSEPSGQHASSASTPTSRPPGPQRSLRIYSPRSGHSEVQLIRRIVTIGRSPESDVRLDDPSISRTHAQLRVTSNGAELKDMDSKTGLVVNGKKTTQASIKPGDNIQIGPFVIEFVATKHAPQLSSAAAQASRMLRAQFRLLPEGMKLRYRTIAVKPHLLFQPGSTLPIGEGGLLIPCETAPSDDTCLEVALTWPNGKERHFLAEILGVIPERDRRMICAKLRQLDPTLRDDTVKSAPRGPWTFPFEGRDRSGEQSLIA